MIVLVAAQYRPGRLPQRERLTDAILGRPLQDPPLDGRPLRVLVRDDVAPARLADLDLGEEAAKPDLVLLWRKRVGQLDRDHPVVAEVEDRRQQDVQRRGVALTSGPDGSRTLRGASGSGGNIRSPKRYSSVEGLGSCAIPATVAHRPPTVKRTRD
jgi:hypothetical protein